MADAKQVQEMLSPVMLLDVRATVADALQRLEQANAAFGIVGDEKGQPLGLVTAEQLRAADSDACLQSLISDAPGPIFIEPHVTIDNAVKMLAKDLVLKPNLAGIIVQEQGQVRGVLPRQVVVEHASQVVTRETADRLEGAPIDVLFFECPEDHERKLVAYYDPQNPPKCSKGHLMKPVED